MESPLDRETRDILIDAFKYDLDAMIPLLTSPKGQNVLMTKYGSELNWQEYLQSIEKTKSKTRLMITKLGTQNYFQEGFISELKIRFELFFIRIQEGIFCLEKMNESKESAQTKFNNLQKIYEKIYPKSIFNFDKVRKGELNSYDDLFKQ